MLSFRAVILRYLKMLSTHMLIRMMKRQNYGCAAKKVHWASSTTSLSGLDESYSVEANMKAR
jgi:hypothetical protein